MASEISKRDQNSVPVLCGITDDASQEIRMLRVDPVTGRLLISNGGSSSSGFQRPTAGIADGVNQVFTFLTAPNVIVIDENRTMQKVNADGGANWTGTTTIDLSGGINSWVPQFDIFSPA